MNRTLQTLKYLFSDAIGAAFSYTIVFSFRKMYIESEVFGGYSGSYYDSKFFASLLAIVAFWLIVYTVFGHYRNIYRRSRLREFAQTFAVSLLGCVFLFFAIVLDDVIVSYKSYYLTFAILFVSHFLFTASGRLILSSITAYRIHHRLLGFNTLMVGSNENALKLYQELEGEPRSSGFRFSGFVHVNGSSNHSLEGHLTNLGHFRNIETVVRTHAIEDTIIAIESSEHDKIGHILNALEGVPVNVKVIPGMYDILSGQVKMSSIFGAPLIDIHQQIMPLWQQITKRVLDITLSVFAMILLAPIFIIIGLGVKLTSPGPIFYSHERIGWHGKPFRIFKFRTMVQNAEANGPALSSADDPRITHVGKALRRLRLDELPQFYNVLRGDMSLVGPRPERAFFIEQILKVAPHYKHLQKVRPGITSWGQVKFGYAENVGEMVERLKFDILYIENMSLMVDFKILIHTILIVLQGRGK